MASLPPASFHSIESLSPQDRELFNRFGRGVTAAPPFTLVHHAFEAVASDHPTATAVRQHDGATISYGELDRRANILANSLINDHGLRRGDRVLLVYSRSIEMVVFIFGVLKAGGQYVPVDGGIIPPETLSHEITDSSASIVLCLPKFQQKVKQSAPSARVAIVSLDNGSSLWEVGDASNPRVDVQPHYGAYVIYTSGTTGKPKGVDVSHSNVTNTLLLEPAKLGIAVGTNVAQQLNVAFDMCAWEILATIMNGGTLNTRGSGNDNWTACLGRVDTVISTPSVALKRFPRHEDFPNLKTIAVGGEPCPKPLADHWAPHANFINICGPTEITILNTAHLHKPGGPLTIGKPNPNTTCYVLDDDENPVGIGEPGVMWVGGAGVSRGYLNLPELTAARYKPDKFVGDGKSIMFNTGDLGRWLEDGSLETLGRRDDQVKINGFRVELDGVSRAIESHPDVSKGCALKIDTRLWGFYSSPLPIDETKLKETVGINQPFYAVPSAWWYLGPTIPLTANGKIDKRALREVAAEAAAQDLPVISSTSSSSSSSAFSPPASDVEKGPLPSNSSQSDSPPSSSNISVTKPEAAEEPLPPKKGFHGWRWFRHTALSAYRKLFSIIFLANLAALIVMLHRSRHDNYSLPLSSLATAVGANLLCSVLLRQDHVVNLIFYLATRLPTSTPLSIRRHLARIYHYGGVHSGCAVAASAWWVILTVSATVKFSSSSSSSSSAPSTSPSERAQPRDSERLAILVLTYLILALLAAILAMAYPTVRARLHDQFEWTHRFAGWTTLALVWAHLVVITAATRQPSSQPLGSALSRSPTLYLLALTTLSIALPWLRLRRVKVVAEPLSTHAVRLHFDFKTPRECSSLGVRITDRPLVEWHAFAAIPEPDGKKGFSLLVSRAGDWTGRIIDNPPASLWTRGEPASGVLAVAPLFRKIVLVATGSGIGPCLPVIMERKVDCRILWSTRNALKTYGRGIIDEVKRCDADAVVWDTDSMGRPDLVKLSWELYRGSGAECVCIISNAKTTKRVVYGLEARGVPAYGPIWDS